MTTETKKELLKQVQGAFYGMCIPLFDNDKLRREIPPQLLAACELAMAGLSGYMARLESEIGTDNL